MDALVLDRIRSASMPGASREATGDRPSRRRRLFQLVEQLRLGMPGGQGGDAISRPNDRLLAFTGMTIALGLGLLVMTTITNELWSAIDPGIGSTTVLAGPTGGLLLWLLYGLMGSLRALRVPGGGVMTFHLPFVGAAMILGGPTAGAWVAFLATVERRELESVPWYGVLANHAVMVVAAVLGAVATRIVATAIPAGAGGGSLLVAAATGAVVLTAVSTGLGAITIALREGISIREYAERLLRDAGRITAVECALVVVFAIAYLQVGWWAPLLAAGFVLLVWDNDPMPPPDMLTGLPGKEGFGRQLETGVGRLRRGVTLSATVLHIDLDWFKRINDNHGFDIGDEVLAEVGRRLRLMARRADDLVGRIGGDEFAMFLPGLGDAEEAVRRADEIVAELCRPVMTSEGPMVIGASIGVVVIARGWGGLPSGATLLTQAADAMHAAKDAGGGSHLFDPDEPRVALGNRRP
jgi:diguanylate cyclase (GGDEF)-like protein